MHYLFAIFFVLLGCNQSEFRSGGDEPKPARPAPLPTPSPTSQKVIDEFDLNPAKADFEPVDIIFVVDTSGSMMDEKERLEESMGVFVKKFANEKKNIDFQTFMIGEEALFNFPQVNSDRFQVVNFPVGSTDALTILLRFLNGGSATSRTRPGVRKHAIIVTDDDAAAGIGGFPFGLGSAADWFKKEFRKLGADYQLHINGLVWLPTSQETETCTKAREGQAYIELAATTEHKGFVGDLCTKNWNGLLQNLADKIIDQQLATSYPLSKPLDSSMGHRVYVNDQLIDASQYTLDPATGRLSFAEGVLPTSGGIVKIEYFSQSTP